jgi:hypothetical protein
MVCGQNDPVSFQRPYLKLPSAYDFGYSKCVVLWVSQHHTETLYTGDYNLGSSTTSSPEFQKVQKTTKLRRE